MITKVGEETEIRCEHLVIFPGLWLDIKFRNIYKAFIQKFILKFLNIFQKKYDSNLSFKMALKLTGVSKNLIKKNF